MTTTTITAPDGTEIPSETFNAYVECALWATTGDDGDALDALYSMDDLADSARASILTDLAGFYALVAEAEADADAVYALTDGWDDSQIGHDFFLTRNGHGAGFWDRYYAGPNSGELARSRARNGDVLTEIAKTFGTSDFYVGDDGLVYCS